MKKRIVAGVAALVLAGSGVFGYNAFQKSTATSAAEIAKEVTVQRGNVTAGVTESAAVNVESLAQTYDLTLTSTSVSASVESSSGGSSRGGMSGMPGGGMGSMPGRMSSIGSTSVSTQSESSAVALIVDEVRITEGQTVKKGDVLMTITQESIDEARAALTEAVQDAELALKQAQIEESETRLSAQYDYDTRMTEGRNALAVYNAAMNEIAQNISDLETQIAECTDSRQLASLESQLASAKSSRTADELAAKQTYEEALMYYENAQDLYDVSVNNVGSASEEAEEAVEAAQADLNAFEAYISDGSIRAEYSGTVTGVGYSSGDTLNAETAIASFADAESITVTVNVTEDDIAAVHLEETVDVSFLSYPDEMFSGYVSGIGSSSSSGNSKTVSYPVTVVITEVPETLLSGMTANVTFITKQVQDVLYVSNKAVITEGADSYVLRKTDTGSEEKVRVQLGFSNGSIAEIEGVSEGDTLLIKGKVS
ncbi:MAG: efflux RND transporter periplasmic adaptor subunit [Oscillospiraceae bacterium]|nr:efflux RND transporter periplasmic adaptor subunit [Oscillospiraceae bacterium]